MELKLKFLFYKKNFIRSYVRKLKALVKLYTDYIDYIVADNQEKLDKKVLKFKNKEYKKFQNTYYDYGDEKAIFDVVYNRKYSELKTEYRYKFRAYRESTRRKIAKLEKKGEDDSVINALKDSILTKDKELEAVVENIANSWKAEFEAESSKRLAKQGSNVSIPTLKAELENRVNEYYQTQKALFDVKTNSKKEKFTKKIANLQQKLEKFTILLTKASEEYVAYNNKLSEIKHSKQVAKARKELDKYNELLANATTAEDKAKYEKILVTVNDNIASLESKTPDITELIGDDEVLGVKDLCMFFGGIKAVNKLSFTVKEKEIFGLIGPNGAGKTTVFNCITQFYKPTSGQLAFRNKEGEIVDLTKEVVHNVILQGIVRTFQNLEVIKEVSVLDNLLIAAHRSYTSNLFHHMIHSRILKVEESVIRARAIKVLDFMGLLKYKDYLAWGLPYGILKKIEIARTLMCDPQLIILDEPAAGLNDSETVELAALIRKIRDEYNSTILLVEHDMGLVMDVCDRICAISFGNLLALGTPEEIQSNKAVQEAYLGVSED